MTDTQLSCKEEVTPSLVYLHTARMVVTPRVLKFLALVGGWAVIVASVLR